MSRITTYRQERTEARTEHCGGRETTDYLNPRPDYPLPLPTVIPFYYHPSCHRAVERAGACMTERWNLTDWTYLVVPSSFLPACYYRFPDMDLDLPDVFPCPNDRRR